MEYKENYLNQDDLVEKRAFWRDFLASVFKDYRDRVQSNGEISHENHLFFLDLMHYVHQIDWGGQFPEEFTIRKNEY